jgi:Zincin-like metallopeptidase
MPYRAATPRPRLRLSSARDQVRRRRGRFPGVPSLYGLYLGTTTAGEVAGGARIVIFRDTLTRDFRDPAELERQVARTLRHEVAHHLGAGREPGARARALTRVRGDDESDERSTS